MSHGIIGRKIGMTQIFAAVGVVTPVTVIKAGPCVVVQKKTVVKDGYEAVQLGFVDDRPPKKVNKPMQGHFQKTGLGAAPTRVLREVRLEDGAESTNVGDKVLVGDTFSINDRVTVVGTSKGRGFAGFMKRHGFGGGRKTHGSMFHRAPGSIGQSAYPSRVFKGTKMAGHMGDARVTVKSLQVAAVDPERNLLMVKGAVPGPPGGVVFISKAAR